MKYILFLLITGCFYETPIQYTLPNEKSEYIKPAYRKPLPINLSEEALFLRDKAYNRIYQIIVDHCKHRSKCVNMKITRYVKWKCKKDWYHMGFLNKNHCYYSLWR